MTNKIFEKVDFALLKKQTISEVYNYLVKRALEWEGTK